MVCKRPEPGRRRAPHRHRRQAAHESI
jgi:hypothetical protein